MKTLSDRVAYAMQEKGCTQSELALACGIKPSSVNDWLSGKSHSMKAIVAIKAARFLGVSITWLIEEKGKPFSHGKDYEAAAIQIAKPIDPDIAEVVRIMETTDTRGRILALGAVKAALQGYKPAEKNRAS